MLKAGDAFVGMSVQSRFLDLLPLTEESVRRENAQNSKCGEYLVRNIWPTRIPRAGPKLGINFHFVDGADFDGRVAVGSLGDAGGGGVADCA